MRVLALFLNLVFVISSLAAPKMSYYDIQDAFDVKIEKKQWSKLVDWNQIESMTSDEKFKLADHLRQEEVIGRKLFFEAKHKPALVQERIKSGKLSKKELALQKLALALVSNWSVR